MNYLDVRKVVEVDGCTAFVVTSDGEDAFVVRKKGNVYEANLKAFKQKVTDADTYAAALGKENSSDGYHTTTLSADWPAATPEELARLFVEQAREKSDDAMLAITQNRSAGQELLSKRDKEAVKSLLRAQLTARTQLGLLSKCHLELQLMLGLAYQYAGNAQQALRMWDQVSDLLLKRQAAVGHESTLIPVVCEVGLRLMRLHTAMGGQEAALDCALVALNRSSDFTEQRSAEFLVTCHDVLMTSTKTEDHEDALDLLLKAAKLLETQDDAALMIQAGSALLVHSDEHEPTALPIVRRGLKSLNLGAEDPDWTVIHGAVSQLSRAKLAKECHELVLKIIDEQGMAKVPAIHRGALFNSWSDVAVSVAPRSEVVSILRLAAKSFSGSTFLPVSMRTAVMLKIISLYLGGKPEDLLTKIDKEEGLKACEEAFSVVSLLDPRARNPAIDALYASVLTAFGTALRLNGHRAFAKGAFVRALGCMMSDQADPTGTKKEEIIANLTSMPDVEARSLDEYKPGRAGGKS